MIRKLLPLASALFALGVAAACGSDAALAPATANRNPALAPADVSARGGAQAPGSLDLGKTSDQLTPSDTALINPGIDTVLALKRSAYLPADVSESGDIGPQGGEINIQSIGAKIDFPAGAVATKTHITMTAKAGWNVAFEFAPHGITFAKPVKVQQDLKFTMIYKLNDAKALTAGYYADDLSKTFLDPWRFFARVSELRHVGLDHPTNPRVAKFYIFHFSGYLMSSGYKGGRGSSDEWQL